VITEFDSLRGELNEIAAQLPDDDDTNSFAFYINNCIDRAEAHTENGRIYSSEALMYIIDTDMSELRARVQAKIKKSE
jgi:hypothetical protein